MQSKAKEYLKSRHSRKESLSEELETDKMDLKFSKTGEIPKEMRSYDDSTFSNKSNIKISNGTRSPDRSEAFSERLNDSKKLFNFDSVSMVNVSDTKHDKTQDSLEYQYNKEEFENELHYLRDLRNNLQQNQQNLQASFKAYEVKNQKGLSKNRQIKGQRDVLNNKKEIVIQNIQRKILENHNIENKPNNTLVKKPIIKYNSEKKNNLFEVMGSSTFSKSVKSSQGNNFGRLISNFNNSSYLGVAFNKDKGETKNSTIKKIDLNIAQNDNVTSAANTKRYISDRDALKYVNNLINNFKSETISVSNLLQKK